MVYKLQNVENYWQLSHALNTCELSENLIIIRKRETSSNCESSQRGKVGDSHSDLTGTYMIKMDMYATVSPSHEYHGRSWMNNGDLLIRHYLPTFLWERHSKATWTKKRASIWLTTLNMGMAKKFFKSYFRSFPRDPPEIHKFQGLANSYNNIFGRSCCYMYDDYQPCQKRVKTFLIWLYPTKRGVTLFVLSTQVNPKKWKQCQKENPCWNIPFLPRLRKLALEPAGNLCFSTDSGLLELLISNSWDRLHAR